MSAQPAVLQVVILRDGLLVGTEVFVPGSYVLGSGPNCEVRLDDLTVSPQHAMLYFQNGRAAIQDSGSQNGVYVNGHRVKACEVRSQDEVTCGPFVLKVRVVSKAPAEKAGPPPEVAALLKGTPAPIAAPKVQTPSPKAQPPRSSTPLPTVAARQSPVELAATVPGPSSKLPARDGPATVYSARKRAELGAPAVNGKRHHEDLPTEAVMVPKDLLDPAADPFDFGQEEATHSLKPEAPPAPRAREAKPAKASKQAASPSVPRIRDGKGTPRLYFELWWGETRQGAKSFKPDVKHPVIAQAAEEAALPLYGFQLPEAGFLLAETRGSAFRVFVPPGAAVETKKGDGFYPMSARELESDHTHRFVSLSSGGAVRFSSGEMSLVAYVAPPPEKVWVSPLFGAPYLLIATMLMALSGFGTFLYFAPKQSELPDFQSKNLPAVAVRLIAPEPKKKEEAKKALEKIKEVAERAEHAKKPQKPQVAAHDKPVPKQASPPPSVDKVTKLLSKLTAAGPGSKDILAAVDKLGNGPGSKFSKNNDYKLSGLIGKAPIANAGLGTFGLGGGGRGGYATQGAELLHGRGSGGIGALGAGGIGRGAVGGTVTRASARSVSVQGSIDREAVAKVVNQHLQEVRGCYERALLKDPALAGKVVLEWSISTEGHVVSAKTKSSTLRNGEVEGCIMNSLKKWQFPLAHGGVVIISYPFLFNSVGY